MSLPEKPVRSPGLLFLCQPMDGTLTLPFILSDIQIRFANDRFEGADQIHYRLKLDGLDRNWNAPVVDPVWRSGSLHEGQLHASGDRRR